VSSNRIDLKFKNVVMGVLKRKEYTQFGPTLAKEKLREQHGYYVSKETLRKWMIEESLWEAKRKKERCIHPRRLRRGRFGELLQGDRSPHDWFEERGPRCSLVIFVDDATSRLTTRKFVPAETIEVYHTILEEHLKKYGRPLGLYTDKHSIFRTSRENIGHREKETHFGRVLKELDIELICAHSPQAKRLVERANGILQDRLIKEMRLRGICSLEDGNKFLPKFIEEYNKKFGKVPRETEDAHRPLREQDDFERIFARRTTRKLSKNLSFQYGGKEYQLHPEGIERFRKTEVTVIERIGKPILVECGGKEYPYTQWEKDTSKPKVVNSKELETHWPTKSFKKPGRHHPWR
jgi:hypothetical protein